MSRTQDFPLPELFWPDEGEPKPMVQAVATISVFACRTNGEKEQIDYTTPDALPNTNALRDAYGPGMFEIYGRSSSGAIVAKRTLRVALKPGQQWRAPGASSATTEATLAESKGGLDPMAALIRVMLERGGDPMSAVMMQHVLSMSKEMASQSNESNARIVEAIASLANARITDQQDLFHTLMKAKPASGSGSVADGVKAYEAGMAKIMEFIDTFQAAGAGGAGGDDEEAKAIDLFKSMLDAFKESKQQANNVVDIKGKTKNAT